MRSADTRLAALQQAYDCGYPEIAKRILDGKVRVYTRSPKSRPGWQVSDYQHPYPDGTDAVVLVDAFAADKPYGYYIVPIDEIKEIIFRLYDEAHPGRRRPVSPEATHAVVSPESVEKYRDKWFYAAKERDEVVDTAEKFAALEKRLAEIEGVLAELKAATAKPKPEQKSAEPPAGDEVTVKAKTARDFVRELDAAILTSAGEIVAAAEVPDELRAEVEDLISNQLHHLSSPTRGWVGTLPVPDRSEWR
jgi:hypothetical protein